MNRIQTSTPFHVDLPPQSYLAKPVAAAARKYLDLNREFHARVAAVTTAKQAVNDAELADRREAAEALAGGKAVTGARGRTVKAEAALSDAVAMREAYDGAVRIAYEELRDVVVKAAPKWTKDVAAEHADAVGRYEAELSALKSAERDVVATGAVLAMLREAPAGLLARSYRPAAQLSIATGEADTALTLVKSHEAAARGAAEPEAVA